MIIFYSKCALHGCPVLAGPESFSLAEETEALWSVQETAEDILWHCGCICSVLRCGLPGSWGTERDRTRLKLVRLCLGMPSGFLRRGGWENDVSKAEISRRKHLPPPTWDCGGLNQLLQKQTVTPTVQERMLLQVLHYTSLLQVSIALCNTVVSACITPPLKTQQLICTISYLKYISSYIIELQLLMN